MYEAFTVGIFSKYLINYIEKSKSLAAVQKL